MRSDIGGKPVAAIDVFPKGPYLHSRPALASRLKACLDNRRVSICTTSAGELDQESLVQELQAALNLKLIVDETDALQRARGWETSIDGQRLIINLTTLSNSQISPITLAGIAIDQ